MKTIIHVNCADEKCSGHDVKIPDEITDTDPTRIISVCEKCGDEIALEITLTVIEPSIRRRP